MTEEIDAWDLIFDGRYEEALPLIEEDGNLHNIGLLHLALGNLDRAADALSKTSQVTSAHGEMLGVCEWLRGNFQEALAHWKEAQNSPAQDAAGGITPPALCYYAAVRLESAEEKKLAVKALRRLWKPNRTAWPSPIAGFLLGKYPEREFTWQECNLPEPLVERWTTQLNFWKGVKCLEIQEPQRAQDFFDESYKPSGCG